ncbi:hypothetical protein H6F86_10715 [Phormidium sp. FACHB-592]|uniref:Uncharacterized protein n=1 Tax=Stenomitos frigidus AS-A4 TaxID=2933935 RepID=A0ABV0KRJ3_9CYAN|nr:hypothetical protein [Phormidium sp. FACHB-592]MBD2074348.1 hypothetical protein [Phormidium sp. FACHB-592]
MLRASAGSRVGAFVDSHAECVNHSLIGVVEGVTNLDLKAAYFVDV